MFFATAFLGNGLAQIPKLISYQGVLTDSDGKAVTDGSYNITVKLFDAETGGIELWTEDHTVTTVNGLFAVNLGSNTALDLAFDNAYFASTTVDGTELLPRTALTSSPYAFSANTATNNPYALNNANGSEQEVVFVDSDSKIGLGTNAPQYRFHLKSKTSNDAQLFIEPGEWSNTGHQANIIFGDPNHVLSAIYGEGMEFYDVNQFAFKGSNVTIENALGIGRYPTSAFDVAGPDGEFRVHPYFGPLSNTTLIAGMSSNTYKGAQLRFGSSLLTNYVDIGTDSLGSFVVEQNDYPILHVNQYGRVGVGGEPRWLFDVIGTESDFSVFGGFASLAGETLVAEFKNKNAPGAIVRYLTGISNAFVDVGTDTLGSFVIEPNDIDAFLVRQNGDIEVGEVRNLEPSLAKFAVRGASTTGTLLQDSEVKLLGGGTAHFSIVNDQNLNLKIQNTSILAQPGTAGFDLMTISSSGDVDVVGNLTALNVAAPSDERYKKNIQPISTVLPLLMQIGAYHYDWRVEDFPDKRFTHDRQMGFIAQELERSFPELVLTNKDGYKSVDYSRITPILVEAIKEQQAQIDQLSADKKALEVELQALKVDVLSRLDALEGRKKTSALPSKQ